MKVACKPMMGSGCKAAISGPSKYFLTMDFAPSAPTSMLPVILEPSSKVAVTLGSPLWVLLEMVLSFLSYYSRHLVSKLPMQLDIRSQKEGIRPERLFPSANRALNFDLLNRYTFGVGTRKSSSAVFPFMSRR